MTNYEKFKDEIIDIITRKILIAVVKGKPAYCDDTNCDLCDYYEHQHCRDLVKRWLRSEYVEQPKLTKQEKAFLEALRPRIKFISRDKNGALNMSHTEPERHRTLEIWEVERPGEALYLSKEQNLFNINFDFIKWEDSEPWSIEELLKLEVEE